MWQDGGWIYLSPKAGWHAFFVEAGQLSACDITDKRSARRKRSSLP